MEGNGRGQAPGGVRVDTAAGRGSTTGGHRQAGGWMGQGLSVCAHRYLQSSEASGGRIVVGDALPSLSGAIGRRLRIVAV